MMTDKPHILCVDDEPKILEGLGLHLRKYYRLSTATNGPAGLAIVDGIDPPEVVVSDMRMPEMDGAAFLALVRERAPEVTRILLTGQADIESAIAAVNHGQVFRFLTKPCAPQSFLTAVRDAIEQHRLISSERVLLDQTLRGSIAAYAQILSLSSPISFGRSIRIKNHVVELAKAAGIAVSWQLDVAATLSQIGCVTLPQATCEKLYYGRALSTDEGRMVERLPQIGMQLVEHIPRLETVRNIVLHQNRNYDGSGGGPAGEKIPQGSRILKIAIDYDWLEASGMAPALCLETLKGRPGLYDPALLKALGDSKNTGPSLNLKEVDLSGLAIGMVLARDVATRTGHLLIGRGQEVSMGLLQRLGNMGPDFIAGPFLVLMK